MELIEEEKKVKTSDKTSTTPEGSFVSIKIVKPSTGETQRFPEFIIDQPLGETESSMLSEEADSDGRSNPRADISDSAKQLIYQIQKNFALQNNDDRLLQSHSFISNISQDFLEESASMLRPSMDSFQSAKFSPIQKPSKIPSKVIVDSSIEAPSNISVINEPSLSTKITITDGTATNNSFVAQGYLCASMPEYSDCPVQGVSRLEIPIQVMRELTVVPVKQMTCGYEHCALVTFDGNVMTWGSGAAGCLGQGSTMNLQLPTPIQTLLPVKIAQIEAGAYHTIALSYDGLVYSWGRGDVHQLGIPQESLLQDKDGCLSLIPRPVELQHKAVGVACGEAHTLLLTADGKILAFGLAEDGQLGVPSNLLIENRMTQEVQIVQALYAETVCQVAAGSLFSACLTEDGQVFVWGNGELGQLGLGTLVKFEDFPRPVTLQEPASTILCGESNVVCLTRSGQIYAWGLGIAGKFREQFASVGSELTCFNPQLLQGFNSQQTHRIKP